MDLCLFLTKETLSQHIGLKHKDKCKLKNSLKLEFPGDAHVAFEFNGTSYVPSFLCHEWQNKMGLLAHVDARHHIKQLISIDITSTAIV